MILVPYLLSGVIIFNFISGIIVLSRSVKDKINEIFGLLSLSVTLWSIGILGFYFVSLPDFLESHWIIVTHTSAALIAMIFFYFSLNFPVQLLKKYTSLFTIPFLFILYYLFFTDKIIGEVINKTYEIQNGYILYILFIMFYFMAGYLALFLQYKRTGNLIIKKQVKYVLIGSIFSSLFAMITDLILPYFEVFQYTWLGPIFTMILVLSIAVAIVKYRLFNIRVIATELLTFAIWIFVLVRALLADTLQERLINGGLFLFLVISGILLIRSVLREVKHREQIEKLAGELEKANVRLKELDQAKSEFVTITSHQLRAPITAIKGYISMLMEGSFGEIPEKAKTVIDKVYQSSDRLVNLINDFLNLSRIERGKMEYDFKEFDLKELAKNIYEDFNQINIKKDAPLKFTFDMNEREKYIVKADQEKIRQAIGNLVDNALKYTKQGFVRMSLYKDTMKEKIIFKIEDSGMGIEKEALSRLFQKFSRAERDKLSVHVDGTGLGLYVAKEIMKAHGGDIRAESRGMGKGTEFYVEFPMNFITPQEKKLIEEEQNRREGNVEEFLKGI